MDIIDRINKQSSTIEKITGDIRNIQKTINTTAATLSRSDAVAEEAIFAAANAPKSDVATVETYRGLTTLRAEFDKLVDCASQLGSTEKQVRDLEIKIGKCMPCTFCRCPLCVLHMATHTCTFMHACVCAGINVHVLRSSLLSTPVQSTLTFSPPLPLSPSPPAPHRTQNKRCHVSLPTTLTAFGQTSRP